jgi:hypothetical protein
MIITNLGRSWPPTGAAVNRSVVQSMALKRQQAMSCSLIRH